MKKFRSLGIDNATLSATIKRGQAERLKRSFIYVFNDKHGVEWRVVIPDILYIRFLGRRLIISMNVPKLSRSVERHNVSLAGIKEVTKAITLAAHTLSIDRSLLSHANVESAHVTYTGEEVDGFEFRQMIHTPKGYVMVEQEHGTYVNSPNGSQTFLAYSKGDQIESQWEVIPRSVEQLLSLDDPTLVRFELRLERQVLRQLKRAGMWMLSSFTAQDLESEKGFFALTRFFEKRLPFFVHVPPVRKSEDVTRSFADAEPVAYSRYVAEHRRCGAISQKKFERESLRAEMLINHASVVSILDSVRELVGRMDPKAG